MNKKIECTSYMQGFTLSMDHLKKWDTMPNYTGYLKKDAPYLSGRRNGEHAALFLKKIQHENINTN